MSDLQRRQYRIPLEGKDAVLWISIPLSTADWSQLLNVLNAMKPGLVEAENTRLTDVKSNPQRPTNDL